jgi:hypothetical protein
MNGACTPFAYPGRRKEQDIPLALMVPLVMIVFHIFVERMPQRRFPKQDQPRQTFLCDRAHPPFRVGVGLHRQLHRIGTIRHTCSRWRCLTGVDSNSNGLSEFVSIDEEPNHEIVHAFRLGEA